MIFDKNCTKHFEIFREKTRRKGLILKDWLFSQKICYTEIDRTQWCGSG
ncbi:hypothetical protein HMPREF0620_0618 [Parascardovia denticolens DSM 10105 = JCM 12538]|uniref:Uncharacterized protein n=1 Tax=Parascardovia denticolens DSM 10105 = JCM 12538 TaxID=864564 RepID=E6K1D2_PARDN|nr:hypothetical protein HMPREF0620_0618 [Parascardovia denticolens DSM 10105 = JCM 12538]BAR05523.1 hypothetical protein PSDT_1004 [Parascardovia denticolens DSM 10105 = JCM 12538]